MARNQCRNEARRSLYHCTPRADCFARRRRFLPTFNLTARSGPFSPKSPSRARRACKNDSEGPSRTARAFGYSPINPYIDPLPFSLFLALPLSPYRLLGKRKSSWLVRSILSATRIGAAATVSLAREPHTEHHGLVETEYPGSRCRNRDTNARTREGEEESWPLERHARAPRTTAIITTLRGITDATRSSACTVLLQDAQGLRRIIRVFRDQLRRPRNRCRDRVKLFTSKEKKKKKKSRTEEETAFTGSVVRRYSQKKGIEKGTGCVRQGK